MDAEKSQRELLHELGNVQQEKVALQYLLGQAADELESVADWVADPGARERALSASARFRRSAQT